MDHLKSYGEFIHEAKLEFTDRNIDVSNLTISFTTKGDEEKYYDDVAKLELEKVKTTGDLIKNVEAFLKELKRIDGDLKYDKIKTIQYDVED